MNGLNGVNNHPGASSCGRARPLRVATGNDASWMARSPSLPLARPQYSTAPGVPQGTNFPIPFRFHLVVTMLRTEAGRSTSVVAADMV